MSLPKPILLILWILFSVALFAISQTSAFESGWSWWLLYGFEAVTALICVIKFGTWIN